MTTIGSGLAISSTEQSKSVQNDAINQLIQGRSNALVEVTLDANVGSTTVTAPNCGPGSAPIAVPMTANAGAEIGNGTMYISDVSAGSFVVVHANNSQTDRTFRFVTLG